LKHFNKTDPKTGNVSNWVETTMEVKPPGKFHPAVCWSFYSVNLKYYYNKKWIDIAKKGDKLDDLVNKRNKTKHAFML